MTADLGAELVYTLAANISELLHDVPEWDMMSMVIDLDGRRFAGTHGYVYTSDGEVSPVGCDAFAIDNAVDEFLASNFPTDSEYPVAVLVQYDKASGRYALTFEDTDRSRWKVDPSNFKTMPEKVRPNFDALKSEEAHNVTFDALASLHNQAALYDQLQQEALQALTGSLGDFGWDADTDAGTLTFTSKSDPSRSISAAAEVIASIAPGPRSMLWGWAIEQGRPDGFAAQLREYGVQHGIAELAEREVPFPDRPIADLPGWVLDAAHQVGAATTAVTGRSPYFAASIGGGSRAVFLLTLDPPLPQPTIDRVLAELPRLLSEVQLTDPRAAVHGLARLSGWSLEWADVQGSAATVGDGTSKALIRFDQQGRITNMEKMPQSEG